MKTLLTATAIAGAALLATGPAIADPKHCPPGHEKQGRCDFGPRYDTADRDWDDRDWERDRAEEAYRAGYEEGRRDGIRVGQRLDGDYRIIRDYDRYGLEAPRSGYYYAQVDEEVLLVQAATNVIAQALGAY